MTPYVGNIFRISIFFLLISYFSFYVVLDDPADKTSLKCLTALESIDDDLDSYGIPAVKMSDVTEARNYGVKSFPSIIVFVKRIPELYQGLFPEAETINIIILN